MTQKEKKAIRQITNQPEKAEVITPEWAAATASVSGGTLVTMIEDLDVPDVEKDVWKHHLSSLRQSLIMLGMLGDPDALLVELFGEKAPVEIVEWDPYS